MSYDLKDASAVTSGVTDDAQFFGALAESSPIPAPIGALALWQYVNGKIVDTYPTFYPTTGIPDNDVGVDSSVAIDYAAGLSYVKAAGVWGGATAMRLRPRGAYSGATAYLVGDVATNQSASWVNLADSTDVAPPTLPTETNANWALLAKSGELTRSGEQTGGIAKFISDTQVSQLSEISVVGGNVGIGTTGPNAKLEVAGTISATDISVTGIVSATDISVTGIVSATDISVTGIVSATYFEGNGSRLSGLTTTTDRIVSDTTSIVANDGMDSISFTTADNQRMTITSAGNVGIGTTEPQSKLAVTGDISLGQAPESTGSLGLIQATHEGDFVTLGTAANIDFYRPVVGWGNEAEIRFSTNPGGAGAGSLSQRMVIDRNGNVGIGTTTPDSLLQIGGTVSANHNSQFDSYGRLILRYDYNSAITGVSMYNRGIGAAGHGIGTTYYLDSSGGAGSPAASVFALSENATFSGATADGALAFSTGLNGTLGERMRIASSGNVGIGTTGPVAKLEVLNTTGAVGTNTVLGLFGKISSDGGGSGILRVTSDSFSTDIETNSGSSISFRFGTFVDTNIVNNYGASTGPYGNINFVTGNVGGSGIAMTIGGGSQKGNVGIGTTAPSYKLHVAGQVAGNAAYVNTSDMRLKKDVVPIAYGLGTVMQLRPVSFNWKEQKEDWQKQHQIGLIAQEVEQVVPEVVSIADDPSQTRSLAYGALVPVLIKSVQELKTANDNLKAEVKAANNAHADEMKALRDEVETLKRAMGR